MSLAKSPTLTTADSGRTLSTDSLAMGIVFALVLTVVQRLLGGVRGIFFCRLMTDQELGQWSLINSFLLILGPFAVLGLPGSFGKFVEHYFQQGQLRVFLRRVGWLCTATTLAVALTLAWQAEYFSLQILGEAGQVALIRLMALTLVVVTLHNYLTSLIESMRQVRLATLMRFVAGVSFTLLGIAFLVCWPQGSYSAVLAFLVSSVLGSLPALWYLWSQRTEVVDDGAYLEARAMWLRLTPYAVWWWASNMVYNLFELTDRYMLVHYARVDSEVAQGLVGQYHSGRVIPLLMVGVASMLGGLLLPYVAKAWTDGNLRQARHQMNWTIKLATLGMVAANLGLMIASPWLFDYFLDGRYDDGLAVMPLTMVYCTWFSIITVSQDYLWVSEQGKYAVGTLAVGLIVNIIANTWLIPTHGLWGAVVATALGNLVGLVLLFWANHRFGCPPDYGCWLAVILPAVLLLPPLPGVLLFGLVMYAAVRGDLIFGKDEKEQVVELFREKVLERFHRPA